MLKVSFSSSMLDAKLLPTKKPPSDEGGGFCEAKDGGRDNYPSAKNQRFLPAPLTRGALDASAPVQLFDKLEFE